MSDYSKAQEELTKLTATWFNTLATGAIVTGVFAPLVQLTDPARWAAVGDAFVFSAIGYGILGFSIHVAGRFSIELRFGQ